uniref:Uncharacterized protein n=1 Tax=Timema bartmani TaxID=61472 RepID=A0A7R9F2Q4_9NEOP|nr:unnamed protein product [Timema bartmani]
MSNIVNDWSTQADSEEEIQREEGHGGVCRRCRNFFESMWRCLSGRRTTEGRVVALRSNVPVGRQALPLRTSILRVVEVPRLHRPVQRPRNVPDTSNMLALAAALKHIESPPTAGDSTNVSGTENPGERSIAIKKSLRRSSANLNVTSGIVAIDDNNWDAWDVETCELVDDDDEEEDEEETKTTDRL